MTKLDGTFIMSLHLSPLFLSRLIITLCFGLISQLSLADDVEEGNTAYQQHDYQAALNAWNPAAQQGDTDAEYNVGQLYRLGQGVKINYLTAQSYYIKAAQKDHPLAQLNLGTMYYSGKLGVDEEESAFYWLHKAAENDNAEAQWMIAVMLFNGQGVIQDSIAAYSWLTLASEQHHPQASLDQKKLKRGLSVEQLNLADTLTIAFKQKKTAYAAIQQQEQDAFYWFHQAAEKGDAHAQWMISDMLLNGQGVAQDTVAAYSWLTLASEQGHLQASLKQAPLRSKLSAEQLNLADRLTKAFKQKKTATATRQQPQLKALIPQQQPVKKTQYRVQVGSFKSQQKATKALTELTKKSHQLLSKQSSTITQPETNSTKADFYRVQFGPFKDKNDANRLCKQLANNNHACFVVNVTAQH
jgi:TPR repeat protein